ncbi:hypothetical protein EMCG_01836 [[Emmonsia] crescens]|uniref:D-isomer specific 2-hydroxyacid dehydrogenase NAD-binding domain-containing protein n=1 Tax=[Emmonsia] crescens TaxID=73230 RepID=A0A0G2I0I4_9EURO|nr:hypothetical protein EMCG_01836 [Emmonsia crescens UAMH 3008]
MAMMASIKKRAGVQEYLDMPFSESRLCEMRATKYFRVEEDVVPYANTPRNRILGVGLDVEEESLGGAIYHSTLKEVLIVADCVVLACPHTLETYHILNQETFKIMKKGVRVVNIGRGKGIDENALADAIEDGTVGCLS